MPPRHHYWTIILEGKPTAFRAHLEEELLPTLRQLQVRHPDAVMKWFARGRLWESQDQERADALAKRRPRTAPQDRRPRDWRPGGEHKDPRDRFKIPRDEKRRRFAENLRRDHREDQQQNARGPRPEWRRPSDPSARPAQFRRPPRTDRPAQPDRERKHDREGKPPWQRDDRERRDERPPWKRDRPPDADRSPGDRRSTPDKPGTPPRPPSRRPPFRGGRPPGQGGRFGSRPQGGGKPGGRKPGGGKSGGGRGGGGRGR